METRRQYIEKLAARLLDWDRELDDMRSKVELASEEARLTYKKKITELRELRERAASELGRLHEAGEPGWHEVKRSADRLADDVGRLLRDLEKAFRKVA